eukprot:6201854-Pleurochrysis_carterae.AAC.2
MDTYIAYDAFHGYKASALQAWREGCGKIEVAFSHEEIIKRMFTIHASLGPTSEDNRHDSIIHDGRQDGRGSQMRDDAGDNTKTDTEGTSSMSNYAKLT